MATAKMPHSRLRNGSPQTSGWRHGCLAHFFYTVHDTSAHFFTQIHIFVKVSGIFQFLEMTKMAEDFVWNDASVQQSWEQLESTGSLSAISEYEFSS